MIAQSRKGWLARSHQSRFPLGPKGPPWDRTNRGSRLACRRREAQYGKGPFDDHHFDDKVTLGQAAAIAGISQPGFLQELGKRTIPIHYGAAELEQDIGTVRKLAGNARRQRHIAESRLFSPQSEE